MDINDIIVDVPAWKWGLAVLFTLGLTLYRYYSEKKWILGAVRLIVLGTICFLLLEPLIRSITTEVEPSTIVLAYDCSQSQWIGADSTERKDALESWATQGAGFFEGKDYNVEVWDFSKQLHERDKWKCDGSRTDLSAALEGIRNKYLHRNVGAVVVTTDGISNRGRDPEFGTQLLEVPHFFIGTGDTTEIQDVEITQLLCNQVTYLNNEFPVEVRFRSNGFKGKKIKLKLYLDSEIVGEENFEVLDNDGFYTSRHSIKAKSNGLKRIKASLYPIEGEERTENNYASSYIEVLDSKRKITIVADVPHPDVQCLKTSLKTNLHQDLDVIFHSELTANSSLDDTDVLIFHNTPNLKSNTPKAITKAINSDTPILFVGGCSMYWNNIPLERSGVSLELGSSLQEISGAINDNFSLFEVPHGLEKDLAYLPPLSRTLDKVKPSNSLNTLIYQRLDALETSWPLLAFNKDAMGRRSGVLMGEGIWRWRMESTIHNGNSKIFDELINNSIQYLDSRDDVRRFRVVAPKMLEEDERVKFSAQVYDASLNPTIDSDISLVLTNSEGEEFDFDFSIENQGYKLDCGRLSHGEYNWKAMTLVDNEVEKINGGFVVKEVKAELVSESANHDLLKRLGNKTSGSFLGTISTSFDNEIGQGFAESINSKVNKKEILHEFTEKLELINFKFILWLVLGGLTFEWVIRRRQGGY